MKWPALLASAVLVAPLIAQSQQPSSSPRATTLKNRPVTLRACVAQGTHGSPGNLGQIEVDPGVSFSEPHRVMYWFYKNIDGFKEHAGHRLEITGTAVAVYEEALELKATDGVFAEIELPNAAAPRTDATTAGNIAGQTAAVSGNEAASGAGDPKTIVIKVEVDKFRMLGSCR